ncbi:hypothetical protein QAD02_022665 [Eretmocerus hayati]|uniref:Uncharacterized protein n=1 Tax=Eretmocerus hayati TaxID=131215 RepID=A0ACC2PTM1_9HYME|nr:hypothetical protein QAD02_022665 [Eretmocerus hayati]
MQVSYGFERSVSENSMTSDDSELIFRFDSSLSSESEGELNGTTTDTEPEEDRVKLRKKRKKMRNHARGGDERTDDGSVRYLCINQGCERSYTSKGAFKQHMRYECGKDLRFECGYCDYKSVRATSIRSHVVRIHKGCILNVLDTHNGNIIHQPARGKSVTHSCMDKIHCVKSKMTRL